jgi:hypothetical protein
VPTRGTLGEREETMAGKLTTLAGFGAGYVLGSRAGRSRYDQIVDKARGIWQDPRVQAKAGQAERLVKEKLPGSDSSTASSSTASSSTSPNSTASGTTGSAGWS